MNVFEFDKSLLERLQESENVLHCKDVAVPASEVRSEWCYHVELQIEPAGWQALWKISRAVCESLSIKYPTIVLGVVNNVLFKELKAEFMVTRVQDDDVHIPENHEVPLEDLWPTIEQENSELNIERTADCVDQLRFFYRNVWMPWDNDNDEDLDWAEKHLNSRIKFCFDLKRGMSRPMADHIRVLLMEARYIQSQREIIEIDMSDDEELDVVPIRGKVTDLMRLHLRLAVIRNEIELLENPEMRQIYEEINFQPKGIADKMSAIDQQANVFIVTKEDTIDHQMEYLTAAKAFINADKVVKIIPTLKECLKISAANDKIYIPAGRHCIKFMEPLNSIGSIKAILLKPNDELSHEKVIKIFENSHAAINRAIIASDKNDNTLMVFNGDYTLENVWLDCRNVRLGVWIRYGTLTLKNCRLVGDAHSSTSNGIMVGDGAACIVEGTTIHCFANGIECGNGGRVKLKNASVIGCRIGVSFSEDSCVECEASSIRNCSEYGAFYEASDLNTEIDSKKIILADCVAFKGIVEANGKGASFRGDINMQNNKKGNIVIFNLEKRSALQNSTFIEDFYSNSDDEIDVQNVSCNQCERLDETIPNEQSTLENRTISIGNGSAHYENVDDNVSDKAHSNSIGMADNSVIVIDDD